MALERDNQHIEAVVKVGSYDLVESVETVTAAVDTKGMRSITFVFVPVWTLDDGDEIYLGAEDSPDNVTFTDVPYYKLLPTEKLPDMTMVAAQNGYLQTMGVESAERYVRVTINPDTLTQREENAVVVYAIMHPENLAFRDWDPGAVSDGNP